VAVQERVLKLDLDGSPRFLLGVRLESFSKK